MPVGPAVVLATLLATLVRGAAALVGGFVTGSVALLTVAVHAAADAADQVLLLLGARRSPREQGEDHPLGYGRERWYWSFVGALVLYLLSGVYALAQAWDALNADFGREPLTSPGLALGLLVVALVAALAGLGRAVAAARGPKGSMTWSRFAQTSRSPELPVVLLEDVGAVVGVLLALLGVALAALTGDPVWDTLAALAVGLLLLGMAVLVAVEMRGLLVGRSATPDDVRAVRNALVGPGVVSVLHLRTQHLGPDELFVGAKIELATGLTVAQVAEVVDAAESRVRRVVPTARVMYLEPALRPEPAQP